MIDIQDFIGKYIGGKPDTMFTVKQYEEWLLKMDSTGLWSYPLSEVDIIVDEQKGGINFEPVRFKADETTTDSNDGYEYRFCEIPEYPFDD